MKKKNGFTLVELLAVIVVLAIIMIIAIPSVLDVMNSARKSSFILYAEKVINAVQTEFVYDNELGELHGAGLYVYDITTDLSLTSTGQYKGYVVVNNLVVDDPQYILYLHDNNYQILLHNATKRKMPTAKDADPYSMNECDERMNTAKTACEDFYTRVYKNSGAADENGSTSAVIDATKSNTTTCYNRKGFIIQNSGTNTGTNTGTENSGTENGGTENGGTENGGGEENGGNTAP